MNIEDYKNTVPYPEAPEKPRMPKQPVGNAMRDPDKITAYLAELTLYHDALKQYEALLPDYHKAQAAYRQAELDMITVFKRDALTELSIAEDHPKAELLFAKAWEHGHSSGLSEVWYWMRELAELLQ